MARRSRYKNMSNDLNAKTDLGKPMDYQIRLKGHLDSQWTDWFDGPSITLEEDGDTLLTGPVVDQSALHGLLKKVRDLGLPLLSLNLVEPSSRKAHRPCGSCQAKTDQTDAVDADKTHQEDSEKEQK